MATEAEKSLWLTHLLENDPEAVELRERTRDWADSNSFGLLKHAYFTSCSAHLDRQRVLELIYQHLHSIGMHDAAFTLAEETQTQFQRKDQQFDRTDLRLLISMSLGPRDNLWDKTGIQNTVLSEERYDIDNFSVHYIEPLENLSESDEDKLISFSDNTHDFSHISFAPLRTLIRILIGLKNIPHDDSDAESFFLLLNTICKSTHFLEHLESFYNSTQDSTIKHNIINFAIKWVNYSSSFIGAKSLKYLDKILKIAQKDETDKESEYYQTLSKTISEIHSPKFSTHELPVDQRPEPEIGKDPTKLLKSNLTLADPEPIEMARQISLAFQEYYAAITPREFYAAIAARELSQNTPAMNELFKFGQQLKYLIAATILSVADPKLAQSNMKRIVDIAIELKKLNNYEALSWFVSAFDMRCLENLSSIRNQVGEDLTKILNDFDWHQESKAYEEMLDAAINSGNRSIPSLRYELSIISRSLYGGDEFNSGKINWGKRQKASVLIKKYIQLQKNQYNFHNISQIQNLLKKGTKLTKEDLNRNSIAIESPIKPNSPDENNA